MRWATLFLPLCMTQLMNLPASFEPNRGSGRRWVLLAVNLRAIYPRSLCLFLFAFSLLLSGARGGGLFALGTVLRASLFAFGDALAIEDAPDNVITDARQVADAASPNEDDRVLLEVMTLAADVGGDLLPVGEPDPRHFPERRVRLLGGHRLHLEADAPLERARLQHRSFGLVLHGPARFADELVDRGHKSVISVNQRTRPCNERRVSVQRFNGR